MARSSEEREFTALLEQVRSEVHGVAEGRGVLVRGQQRLQDMIAALGTRMMFVENAIGDQVAEIREIKTMCTEIKNQAVTLGTRLHLHEQAHRASLKG